MPTFDLTDEDAEGLARLASAQLRLALRFAERAEAEEDSDAACKLARSSERAARSYRQALLLKMKLKRGVPAEISRPKADDNWRDRPDYVRMDLLQDAFERLRDEESLDDEDEQAFGEELLAMSDEGDLADGDAVAQFARICEALERPLPAWAAELAELSDGPEAEAAAAPDSS